MEDGEAVKRYCGVVAPPSEEETFGELFDEFCVFYMSIGVSYNDYWHGDTEMLKYTYLAWQKKQTREFEERNEMQYLAGLYNYNAISSVAAQVLWIMNEKKGLKPDGYLEAPIAFTENEKKAEEKRMIEKTLKWFKEGQKNA